MAEKPMNEAPGNGSLFLAPMDRSAPSPEEHANRVIEIFRRHGLPDPGEYQNLLEEVLITYSNENEMARPRDDKGVPGGLIYLHEIPTIVVPDLHARMDFFLSILLHQTPQTKDRGLQGTILGALSRGEVQIVCVGDGFHSEARAAERWFLAYREFTSGFRSHVAMDAEMRESLGLMEMVIATKIAYPHHFHYLKGNHDNIANEEGQGNYPFGKFVHEGAMVALYVKRFYGTRWLKTYYNFEKCLPVLAVGTSFLVTHGEPRNLFVKDHIINYRRHPEVIYGLTWTDNDAAKLNAVSDMISHYLSADKREVGFIIGGHRPVSGRFRLRAKGRYVQIHNPEQFNVALIGGDKFDPKLDVIEVPKTIELP